MSVGKSVCFQKCAWLGLKFSELPRSFSSRRRLEPFSTFLEKACGDVCGDASGEVCVLTMVGSRGSERF